MRLIDADDLGVGRCSKDVLPAAYCAGWNGLLGLIEKAPTVDVAPVAHGRWVPNCVDSPAFFVCDQCNTVWYNDTKFCPNCGARMDGDSDALDWRGCRAAQPAGRSAVQGQCPAGADTSADGVLICTNCEVSEDCRLPVWPQHFCGYGREKDGGEEDIVETVPVVRCENCLYWVSGKNECESWEWCTMLNRDMPPHAFCNLGVRKE